MPRKNHTPVVTNDTAARPSRLRRAALCLVLVLCGGASALAQRPSLVSVNAAGNASGNGASDAPELSVSDDGRFAVFVSDASDLVANDTNGTTDVFIRDLATGVNRLVSVNAAGTASGNGRSGITGAFMRSLAINGDGRYVVFSSAATDLTPSATIGGAVNVFVRDLAAGTTTLVSSSVLGGGGGNGASFFPSITPDGSSVCFRSNASNLIFNDTNGMTTDVFVRRLNTGTTLLVSANAAGTGTGDRASEGIIMSDDGRYVAFSSRSTNLAANDTNGSTLSDVFLRDLVAGTTTLVSARPDNVTSGNGDSFAAVVSANGARVVFISSATNLVSLPDNNQDIDVFVRDIRSGVTTLASVNRQGTAAGAGFSAIVSSPAISNDGNLVAYLSGAPDLVDNDTNNAQDIFVRNVATGTTTLATTNLSGTASGNGAAGENYIGMSGDGRFISFESIANDLVANDSGNRGDVFVRDLQTSKTTLVSVNTTGTGANGFSFRPVLSRNGAAVVFTSEASDLDPKDTDTQQDVFSFLRNGQVRLSAEVFNVAEDGGAVTITVTRTGDTTAEAFVDYATNDGTANDRRDYTAALGRLRFAAGEDTKTFQIVITDDRFNDDGESFNVTLTAPTGAALGAPANSSVNIADNDGADGPSPVKDASFNTDFFVRQHYADFLNRVPDEGGRLFWIGGIESCGADQQCREVKKVDTSAAFFLSIEFQETGFLAYRAHKAAFGDLPGKPVPIRLRDFLFDTRQIGDGVIVGTPGWPEQLEANKQAYFNAFVTRLAFTSLYSQTMTAAEFVDALFARANILPTQAERNAAIAAFGAGGATGRAAALRSVAESQTLKAAETNKAFVLMQYFGYLRRNPDDPQDTNFDGYNFWLTKLNQFNGNFVDAEMVKAFIQSIEYGNRFGL